jgi:hypothetical protein
MDPFTISAVITHTKVASDIVKGLISLKTSTEVNSKAIELQSIILELQNLLSQHQQVYFEEITKRQNAETKIKELENWENTATNYEFHKIGFSSVSIFVRKPFLNDYEKDTYICPNCYNNKTESFLQPKYNKSDYSIDLFCPNKNCDLHIQIFKKARPSGRGIGFQP